MNEVLFAPSASKSAAVALEHSHEGLLPRPVIKGVQRRVQPDPSRRFSHTAWEEKPHHPSHFLFEQAQDHLCKRGAEAPVPAPRRAPAADQVKRFLQIMSKLLEEEGRPKSAKDGRRGSLQAPAAEAAPLLALLRLIVYFLS